MTSLSSRLLHQNSQEKLQTRLKLLEPLRETVKTVSIFVVHAAPTWFRDQRWGQEDMASTDKAMDSRLGVLKPLGEANRHSLHIGTCLLKVVTMTAWGEGHGFIANHVH